jgi:alkylhydroperoxidase family enzyme
MPRIPYQPADLSEPAALVDAIRTRRGGELLNLDRMLLHSPPLAKGWNAFLGEVRGHLELSPKLRELAICMVALLNGADYEFRHHAPEFIKAGGTAEQLDALQNQAIAHIDTNLFTAEEYAVIALTGEMTQSVQIGDTVFAAARAALKSDRLLVELTGVIAAYNMVSRFLVALGIEPELERHKETTE